MYFVSCSLGKQFVQQGVWGFSLRAGGCSWLEQVELELPTLFQIMKILSHS